MPSPRPLAALVIALTLAGCATRETPPPAAAPPPQDATPGPAPEPVYGSSLGLGPAAAGAVLEPDALIARVSIAGRPVLGRADAPVTVVEFTDYECPYCQGFAKDTWPELKANYVDTGKVRYVAWDFPLPKHERARPAAAAAACAGEQGQFWPMHDALLAAAGQLRDADFTAHAARLGLDTGKFKACLAAGGDAARLDAGIAAARRLGVRGTPSFLVGGSAGETAQGRLLQGNEDYATFAAILDRYLAPATGR